MFSVNQVSLPSIQSLRRIGLNSFGLKFKSNPLQEESYLSKARQVKYTQWVEPQGRDRVTWISVVATPTTGCKFQFGFRFQALCLKTSLSRALLPDSVSFRIMKTCLRDKSKLYKFLWLFNVLVSQN